MKWVCGLFWLASGCAAPAAFVEAYAPAALPRTEPLSVLHPAGQTFALDPARLQQEVALHLAWAGFTRVSLAAQGRSAPGAFTAMVRSELMPRPLEDYEGRIIPPLGERVLSILEIRDPGGAVVFRASLVEKLSSALTEVRVARELVRPLSG